MRAFAGKMRRCASIHSAKRYYADALLIRLPHPADCHYCRLFFRHSASFDARCCAAAARFFFFFLFSCRLMLLSLPLLPSPCSALSAFAATRPDIRYAVFHYAILQPLLMPAHHAPPPPATPSAVHCLLRFPDATPLPLVYITDSADADAILLFSLFQRHYYPPRRRRAPCPSAAAAASAARCLLRLPPCVRAAPAA